MEASSEWISLREFSQRLGVSLAATQKAIATGRVRAFRRGANGRIEAIHATVAVDEWTANTLGKIQRRVNRRAHELARQSFAVFKLQISEALMRGDLDPLEIDAWAPAVQTCAPEQQPLGEIHG